MILVPYAGFAGTADEVLRVAALAVEDDDEVDGIGEEDTPLAAVSAVCSGAHTYKQTHNK